MLENSSLEERVYLERVKLFFGNGVKNAVSALLGGVFVVLILNAAGAPLEMMTYWYVLLAFFAVVTAFIEQRYTHLNKSLDEVNRWVTLRSGSGMFIAIFYGVTPFVFHSYMGLQEEMFLFIVLSAITTISIVSYSTMPFYYTTLSLLSMTPLSFYFLLHLDKIHIILALTALIWQFLLLSKAWVVSKAAINAIRLSEKLQDEIKEHEATKVKLQELATHDTLTGLPNRLLLMQTLDSMLAIAQRNGHKIIVMFLDLDGFKEVNDSYGHEAGDFVLIEVANRLRSLVRKSDTLARMGGDEFILGFMKSDEVEFLANRIVNAIAKPVMLPNGALASIGASIGVALYGDDGATPEELLKVADDRMYISKARGKNSFTFKA